MFPRFFLSYLFLISHYHVICSYAIIYHTKASSAGTSPIGANLSDEKVMNRLPKLGEDKPLYLSPRQGSPTMLRFRSPMSGGTSLQGWLAGQGLPLSSPGRGCPAPTM